MDKTGMDVQLAGSFVAACPPARVLVVEDHEINRQVARMLLQAIGCQVTFAENGLVGVQACAAQAFDMVLMDLQMPVMDGLTAVRQIRAREAALAHGRTAIAMLSANIGPEYEAAARCAGADAYIGKPVSLETLMEGMAQAVALARERDVIQALVA